MIHSISCLIIIVLYVKAFSPASLSELKNAVDICLSKDHSGHCSSGRRLGSTTSEDMPNWDVSKITDMHGLFSNIPKIEVDLSTWQVGNVKNMSNMFRHTPIVNVSYGSWDTSQVVDMRGMFEMPIYNERRTERRLWTKGTGGTSYVPPWYTPKPTNLDNRVQNWDVSSVMFFDKMFSGTTFNGDISKWNTNNAITMREMFSGASEFNQDISMWTYNDVDVYAMFTAASKFNMGSRCGVNTGKMFTGIFSGIYYTFFNADCFNQDVVSTLTGSWLLALFYGADKFNSRVEIIGKPTYTKDMFKNAVEFNNVLTIDTSEVTSMQRMFENAYKFNQNISSWDVSRVTDMNGMFMNAKSFNQVLNWKVSGTTVVDMFKNTAGCPIGKMKTEDLTLTTAGACEDCPEGYYQSESLHLGECIIIDHTACKPCPRGTYNDEQGIDMSIQMPVCKSCQAGKYQDQTGQTACTVCAAGKYGAYDYIYESVDATISTGVFNAYKFCSMTNTNFLSWNAEQGGASCKNGYTLEDAMDYCSGDSDCSKIVYWAPCDTSCAGHNTWEKKYWFLRVGESTPTAALSAVVYTRSTLGICSECPSGSGSPTGSIGSSSCSECGAGKYVDGDCKWCQAGKYQGLTGQTACTECPAGTYQNWLGETECKSCPSGYHSGGAMVSCFHS